MADTEEEKSVMLNLSFNSLEPGWPFMDFKLQISSLSPFLLLEEQLVIRHGSYKNLKIFFDYQKKNEVVFDSLDKLGDKLIPKGNPVIFNPNKQICLYYEFDNGYEWPLLSS